MSMSHFIRDRRFGQFAFGLSQANGYTSQYMHASKLLVRVGQQVGLDTQLMISGNTAGFGALSLDPHLHIQVVEPSGQRIDPKLCLP